MNNRLILGAAKWFKGMLEYAWYPIFCLTGRKLFLFKYGYSRKRQIEHAISRRHLDAGELPDGYGFSLDERIIERFSARRKSELYFRYTQKGWSRASRDELRDATYFDIRRNRNYDPDYAAASRGLACLELVK